jgi:hypothetical protein
MFIMINDRLDINFTEYSCSMCLIICSAHLGQAQATREKTKDPRDSGHNTNL